MKIFDNIYNLIISPENLFIAWERFSSDKQKRKDVMRFEWNLERDIFSLHRELANKTYRHGPYSGFYIRDPKARHIHKATVRDRVVHHAIFRVLNLVFDPTFIPASFSCRIGKGTHKGVRVLENMARKVSRNYTGLCYALKCDIRKFFDSVNHDILLSILKKRIKDADALWLLEEIIGSYTSVYEREKKNSRVGIPIGNLTSQFFANAYMNEFDQFVKHGLKVKQYVRYTDDFIIVHENRQELEKLLPLTTFFLQNRLALRLHPKKVSICPIHQGINFLGYVLLPYYRVVRTKTRRRIFRKVVQRIERYNQGMIELENLEQTIYSYLGVLSHADAYKVSQELLSKYWFSLEK